ncbi:LPXTG cell wall anchor domain-containing protein [Bacillus sp. FJAT-45066]|uniref:LPXTG cell wall anchor domain-containing protein n=1 Tax=Bacillus sp. FJAT-45066 TaxID=2011010 RepID=UPI000BB79065|nr:LPXTG cell wall anchor domain-containing protein [Bacillus sp. FJAT-45066]
MKHRIYISLLIVLGIFIFLSPFHTTALANKKLIDLDDDNFFYKSNFAPGGTTSSTVKLTNISEDVINYNVSLKRVKGSKKLYDTLEVSIFLHDQEIHVGKFLDIKKIALGNLEAGENTPITFSIYFPKESGNEFQGERIDFDLVVDAKMGYSDIIGKLPTTGEDGYSIFYIIGSIILAIGMISYTTHAIYIKAMKRRTANEGFIH